ncbi:MAG: methionine biosynthesis protein MetW [Candidatus Ancaeobacter aquaticus]|nr:methionine biosynthesis protein MetW [Candidatus Ancaeobacter aquaticus]
MLRKEFDFIASIVSPGARVLDLGCGDGTLLEKLVKEKDVIAQGVEISETLVHECIMKDLSVLHFDIDQGLIDYRDNSFDYVVINQTLQAVNNPKLVIDDALRVGRNVIIGFPNFAFWSIRWNLAINGRIHNTPGFPYKWYDKANIHTLTVRDFIVYCKEEHINISHKFFVSRASFLSNLFSSLFSEVAIFCISKKTQ